MQGDGLLFECSIGLFTSGPALNPNMVIGDFVAATFGGYAALTAQTFGAPFLNSANQLQLTSPRLQWICTATPGPESLLGYYAWREGTPDVLLFADRFAAPIVIDQIGDGVAFLINAVWSLLDHGGYLFVA